MKQLLLFASLLLAGITAKAQSPAIQWQKSLGGSSGDVAYCIKQTSDGGYIIAGYTASNDSDVTGNHGSDDYWVVKLDDTGALQWQKTLGGSSADNAYSIQQTTDGGYIIAGESLSSNDDITDNHGNYDYWVVKLDDTGTLQWQKSLGGSADDDAYSIRQTTDGGYIVAGYSNSTDSDITGNHGGVDYWVVKLNDTGAMQWQKSLGGSAADYAYSIRQTTDGGYIVAGNSNSIDGDVTGNHGDYDCWIVKLDGTGNLQWQKSIGGPNSEYVRCIQQTADGGYIVTGYYPSVPYYGDYWVVKLNDTGSIEWQKQFGGSNFDDAYSIQQIMDGGYIVAGVSKSTDGSITGNHGSDDYWIVKLDDTGTLQWQKTLGGSALDDAHSIQQTADGGYIVAGFSTSTNGDVTSNYGNYDFWVVKLAPDMPLALYLLSFTGKSQDNTNILSWVTVNEENMSRFVVERSANGKDFTRIGSVAAANTGGQRTYTFTDQHPLTGVNYYRLKIGYVNGNFAYSNIVRLSSTPKTGPLLAMYPNPAKGTLNISVTGTPTHDAVISINDITGKTIKTVTMHKNHMVIDISALTPGAYTLLYQNSSYHKVRKFMVEK